MTTPKPNRPLKRETLADRVSADITERILSQELAGGTALPTEPELAESYGVSRSVIRDATRLLAARGLVEIHHGKGVFVTSSQREGFADALLLALRRDNATAWDGEEFIDRLHLLAVSLATANATDEEIDRIDDLGKAFLDALDSTGNINSELDIEEAVQAAQTANFRVRMAVFEATHNKVIQHLAEPLLSLRRLRLLDFTQILETLEDREGIEALRKGDHDFHAALMARLRSRDPKRAFTTLWKHIQFRLPPEAMETLKDTPIGESPHIVLKSPFPESLLEQIKRSPDG